MISISNQWDGDGRQLWYHGSNSDFSKEAMIYLDLTNYNTLYISMESSGLMGGDAPSRIGLWIDDYNWRTAYDISKTVRSFDVSEYSGINELWLGGTHNSNNDTSATRIFGEIRLE